VLWSEVLGVVAVALGAADVWSEVLGVVALEVEGVVVLVVVLWSAVVLLAEGGVLVEGEVLLVELGLVAGAPLEGALVAGVEPWASGAWAFAPAAVEVEFAC